MFNRHRWILVNSMFQFHLSVIWSSKIALVDLSETGDPTQVPFWLDKIPHSPFCNEKCGIDYDRECSTKSITRGSLPPFGNPRTAHELSVVGNFVQHFGTDERHTKSRIVCVKVKRPIDLTSPLFNKIFVHSILLANYVNMSHDNQD
jgi:hypothetical protein